MCWRGAGPADSFDEAETIIPLEVLDDIFDIMERIIMGGLRVTLNTLKGQSSKVENEIDSDKSFASWRIKYPILENTKPSEFSSVLLQHYVQPPSRIIHLLGKKVLCQPFEP